MAKSDPKKDKIELRPDGWQRFDRAVTAAAKSGPKHKVGKTKSVKGSKKKAPLGRG
jgi:hypothetical protein